MWHGKRRRKGGKEKNESGVEAGGPLAMARGGPLAKGSSASTMSVCDTGKKEKMSRELRLVHALQCVRGL